MHIHMYAANYIYVFRCVSATMKFRMRVHPYKSIPVLFCAVLMYNLIVEFKTLHMYVATHRMSSEDR